MTASLTPSLALDFITALSADIRAAVVLDASGAHFAGPVRLAEAARGLAADGRAAASTGRQPGAGDDSWGELEGEDARGKVFIARDERHTIVVVTGPFALARVTRHDLRSALSALGGQNGPTGPVGRLDEAWTRALLSAV
jgi:hypothetical protein